MHVLDFEKHFLDVWNWQHPPLLTHNWEMRDFYSETNSQGVECAFLISEFIGDDSPLCMTSFSGFGF